MNKRLIGIITTMLALLLTTGCGNNKTNEVNTNNNGGKDNSLNASSSNDVCPGCVYAYTTDIWLYNESFRGKPTVLTKDQYKTNYQDIVDETKSDTFLGLKLDKKGTIKNAYACSVIHEKLVCIEGTSDGKEYKNNLKKLQANGIYDGTNGVKCTEYNDRASCIGGPQYTTIDANGEVMISGSIHNESNGTAICSVLSNGVINCKEVLH